MDIEFENDNTRLDRAMEILENDPALNLDEDDQNTNANKANDPAGDGNTKPPAKDAIGEDQDKPNDDGKDKPQDENPGAIEPPNSWSSDDKVAFANLPEWAQQTIVRRENERESYLGERSRVLAAREQEVTTIQSRATQAQQQYAADLDRATQLVSQLMPAKFADIQSEADYLRVKMEDPQRASEFDVFNQLMRGMTTQRQQLAEARAKEHLDNEWNALRTKYPEFQDAKKAETIISDVRKACTDYYGFRPEEVATFADHRHIQIVRDAIAWKNHQANLKAAESKKVPKTPSNAVLRTDGNAGSANLNADQKIKILTSANRETDLRKRADKLAALL